MAPTILQSVVLILFSDSYHFFLTLNFWCSHRKGLNFASVVPLGEISAESRPNLPHGDVLSSGGGVALGVLMVERIVAGEVDQSRLYILSQQ